MDPNKQTLEYDLCSVPPGMTMDEILRLYSTIGLLLYDSSKGNPPHVIVRHNYGGLTAENIIFGIPGSAPRPISPLNYDIIDTSDSVPEDVIRRIGHRSILQGNDAENEENSSQGGESGERYLYPGSRFDAISVTLSEDFQTRAAEIFRTP